MSRKRCNIVFGLFLVSLCLCLHCSLFSLYARDSKGRFVVVLDPGHGGKDPGAIGSITNEKSINLGVALKVRDILKNKDPNIVIKMTRSGDNFIGLDERANFANKNHADLFISIHTNSAGKRGSSARGTEVFTLGLARTKENLEVAKKENSVILIEEDYSVKYEGFDPHSTESYIIFEFMQNKYLESSINLADMVQKSIVSTCGRNNRGVKQAGFLVLRKTSMPSILIELGFITNPQEERYMHSSRGKSNYANAIASGIIKYKNTLDKRQAKTIDSSYNTNNKENSSSNISDNSQSVGKKVYRIQVLAHPKKLKASNPVFKGYRENIAYYKENSLYKYTIFEFESLSEAKKMRRKVAKDFKDCFIVTFVDGERISETYY